MWHNVKSASGQQRYRLLHDFKTPGFNAQLHWEQYRRSTLPTFLIVIVKVKMGFMLTEY